MVSMNGNGFESLLVCPVCLDAFKDPKVLPCLHTFCIKCISNCCKPLRFVYIAAKLFTSDCIYHTLLTPLTRFNTHYM